VNAREQLDQFLDRSEDDENGSARVGVVVVAAGSGSRLGSGGPKALVEVAGRSLLAHALMGLAAAGLPPAVVVHTPGRHDEFAASVGELPVAAYVPGGASRTESVRLGVTALPASVEIVVIHDAARPLMPPQVIVGVVTAVLETSDVIAAAPGLPVSDTLKRIDGDTVVGTLDRERLVGIQTPQVFPRWVLQQALASADDATDDLGLVEALLDAGRLQGRVVVVPGSAWGRKVTFPSDLALIEALAGTRPPEDPTMQDVIDEAGSG
jgi:2-C-methyl-D-erythritol 4-phosphate cytidylyltransferase